MNVKLELPEHMVQVIGEALGNAPLPMRLTLPVVQEIQRQVDEQGIGKPQEGGEAHKANGLDAINIDQVLTTRN